MNFEFTELELPPAAIISLDPWVPAKSAQIYVELVVQKKPRSCFYPVISKIVFKVMGLKTLSILFSKKLSEFCKTA